MQQDQEMSHRTHYGLSCVAFTSGGTRGCLSHASHTCPQWPLGFSAVSVPPTGHVRSWCRSEGGSGGRSYSGWEVTRGGGGEGMRSEEGEAPPESHTQPTLPQALFYGPKQLLYRSPPRRMASQHLYTFFQDKTEQWRDGCCSANGRVVGTYVHGLFSAPDACDRLVAALRPDLRLPDAASEPNRPLSSRDAEYDKLADHFRSALDLDRLWAIVGL